MRRHLPQEVDSVVGDVQRSHELAAFLACHDVDAMLRRTLLPLLAARAAALVVPMKAANPTKSLTGQRLERANGAGSIDVGAILQTTQSKTLVVLGTHAADFNACEYMQKVRFYLPRLAEAGVDRYLFVVNGDARQASKLAELLDLPDEVELLADPTGAAGRRFGCDRGFRPDDAELNPYVKLAVVGLGFGPPWQTLPPVLAGYFGSPNGKRDWIEAAMRQNELAGRTPAALTLGADGAIVANKFDNVPLDWGVRPFELATLRLQNLKDVQLAHYDELKPADDRCLTQLGGCAVVGPGGAPLYSWVDRGLCDVPDFEALLEAIDVPDEPAFDFSTPAPAAAPEPASPEPYSVKDYLSETLGAPKPPASQPKAPEAKTPRRWGGAAAPKKPAVPIKAESPPAFPIKAETVKEAAAALRAKAPKAETVKEAAAALRAQASKVAPKAETVKEAAAALKSNAARTAANNKARAVAPAAALQAQAAKAAAANKAKADAAKARRAAAAPPGIRK